jgi:hypothetical protein
MVWVRDILLYGAAALALIPLLRATEVRALENVVAESLPAFNVLCYRIIITNFSEDMYGQIVMGKADDEARYNLFTMGGNTLKIINNPESPGLRQEYGKYPAEINVSPIKDPGKRPPVFSWQEKTNGVLAVFSFEARDKVLSVVRLYSPIGKRAGLHTNEVLKCMDK